jgi:hypothetical protein
MKLILQGMRRSGTTIVYDALAQDPELTHWYEPLAAATKPAMGGGSGARDVDVYVGLRQARESFLAEHGLANSEVLNFGAPRDASLEFSRQLPHVVEEYLRYLLDRPRPVAAKFTRLYTKVPLMHLLFPLAGFVHLVRDPRAVAMSYLFGKNRRYEKRVSPRRVFFGRRSERTAWSSYPISERIRHEYRHEELPEPTDLERVLLIWRYTYEKVRDDAAATFGTRTIRVRHEDFCADPVRELDRMYSLAGRHTPDAAVSWARAHLRNPSPIHAAGDRRWRSAFERMGMVEAVESCGYDIG